MQKFISYTRKHWYRWVLYISTTLWLVLAALHVAEELKQNGSVLGYLLFFLVMAFSGWVLGDVHKSINKDERL